MKPWIGCWMNTITKKAKKKLQVTLDEALDLLLAEHDRKKAKSAKRAVGRAQFAIQDQESMDEEEIGTQPPGAQVAKNQDGHPWA